VGAADGRPAPSTGAQIEPKPWRRRPPLSPLLAPRADRARTISRQAWARSIQVLTDKEMATPDAKPNRSPLFGL